MRARFFLNISFIFLWITVIYFINPSFSFASSTYITIYFLLIEKNLESVEIKVYYGAGNSSALRTIRRDGTTTLSYLHPDYLDSTVLVTNNTKNPVSTVQYYPYGSEVSFPTNITDKLYTNQRKDSSSNLYFYNARYYNPNTTHFISADKAEGPNRYAYVGNNPIMKNDPSGNWEVKGEDLTNDELIVRSIERKFPVILLGNYTTSQLRRVSNLLSGVDFNKIGRKGDYFSVERYESLPYYYLNNVFTDKLIIDFSVPYGDDLGYGGVYYSFVRGRENPVLGYVNEREYYRQYSEYVDSGNTGAFDYTSYWADRIIVDPYNSEWESVLWHEFYHEVENYSFDLSFSTSKAIRESGGKIEPVPPWNYKKQPGDKDPGIYGGFSPSVYGRSSVSEWGAETARYWNRWSRYIHRFLPAYYAAITDYLPGLKREGLGGVIE